MVANILMTRYKEIRLIFNAKSRKNQKMKLHVEQGTGAGTGAGTGTGTGTGAGAGAGAGTGAGTGTGTGAGAGAGTGIEGKIAIELVSKTDEKPLEAQFIPRLVEAHDLYISQYLCLFESSATGERCEKFTFRILGLTHCKNNIRSNLKIIIIS